MARLTLEDVILADDADNIKIRGESRDRRLTGADAFETGHGDFNVQATHPLGETGRLTLDGVMQEGGTVEKVAGNYGYGREGFTAQTPSGGDFAEGLIDSGQGTAMTHGSTPGAEVGGFARRALGGKPNNPDMSFADTARQVIEDEGVTWNPAEGSRPTFDRNMNKQGGMMGAAWDRGVSQLQMAGGGATSYLGELIGNDAMRASGDEYAQNAAVDALLNPARVADFSAAMDSPSNFAAYVGEAVGENLPALIPDIIAALGGAGFGAAALRGARTALVREAGKKYGAGLGAAMSMGTQSGGSFAHEMTQDGIEDRGATPMAVGAGVAAANILPGVMVFGRAAKAAGLSDAATNRAMARARDVLETAAVGGATELIASPVSMLVEDMGRISADMMSIDDMNIDAYIEGTIRGAIAGTGMGGTVGGIGNIAGAVTDAYTDARTVVEAEQGATTEQYVQPEFSEVQGVFDEDGTYTTQNIGSEDFGKTMAGGRFTGYTPTNTPEYTTVSPEVTPTATKPTETTPRPNTSDDSVGPQPRKTQPIDKVKPKAKRTPAQMKRAETRAARRKKGRDYDNRTDRVSLQGPGIFTEEVSGEFLTVDADGNAQRRQLVEQPKPESMDTPTRERSPRRPRRKQAQKDARANKRNVQAWGQTFKDATESEQAQTAVERMLGAAANIDSITPTTVEGATAKDIRDLEKSIATFKSGMEKSNAEMAKKLADMTPEERAAVKKANIEALAKAKEANDKLIAMNAAFRERDALVQAEREAKRVEGQAKADARAEAQAEFGDTIVYDEIEGLRYIPKRKQQNVRKTDPDTDYREKSIKGTLPDSQITEYDRIMRTDEGGLKPTNSEIITLMRGNQISRTDMALYAQSKGVDISELPQTSSRIDLSLPRNREAKNIMANRLAAYANGTSAGSKAKVGTKEHTAYLEQGEAREAVSRIISDTKLSTVQKIDAALKVPNNRISRRDVMYPVSTARLLDAIRQTELGRAAELETEAGTQQVLSESESIRQEILGEEANDSLQQAAVRGKYLQLAKNVTPAQLKMLDTLKQNALDGVIPESTFVDAIDKLHSRLPASKQFDNTAEGVDATSDVAIAESEQDIGWQAPDMVEVDSESRNQAPDQMYSMDEQSSTVESIAMGYQTAQERNNTVAVEMARTSGTLAGLAQYGLSSNYDAVAAVGYDAGTANVAYAIQGTVTPDPSPINTVMTNDIFTNDARRIRAAIRSGNGQVTPHLISVLRSVNVNKGMTATNKKAAQAKEATSVSTLIPDVRESSSTFKAMAKVRRRKTDYKQGVVTVTAPGILDRATNQTQDNQTFEVSAPRVLAQYIKNNDMVIDSVATEDMYGYYVDAVEQLRQTAAYDGIPLQMDGFYHDTTLAFQNPENLAERLTLGELRRAYERRTSKRNYGESKRVNKQLADVKQGVTRALNMSRVAGESADGAMGADASDNLTEALTYAKELLDFNGETYANVQAFDDAMSDYAKNVGATQATMDAFYTVVSQDFGDVSDAHLNNTETDARGYVMPENSATKPGVIQTYEKNIQVTNKTGVDFIGAEGSVQARRKLKEYNKSLVNLQQIQSTGTFSQQKQAFAQVTESAIAVGSHYMNEGFQKAAPKLRDGKKLNKLSKNIATDITHTVIGRLGKIAPALAKVMHDSSGQGYFRSVENRRRMFYASAQEFLNDAALMNKALHDLQSGVASTEAKKLGRFLSRFNGYVKQWNPEANVTNAPTILRTSEIQSRKSEVLAILRAGGSTTAESDYNALLGSGGSMEFSIDVSPYGLPGARNGANRIANRPEVVDAFRNGGFVQPDATNVLIQYIAAGIRNAEWHKVMSKATKKDGLQSNVKYNKMIEGIEPGSVESRELTRLMEGMLGQSHSDIPKGWRLFNSVAIGFNNLRLLAFSGLSTIPEAGIVLARTHSVKFAAKNLSTFARQLVTKQGRADLTKFATELGMLEGIVNKSSLTQLYGVGELSVNSTMTRATDMMFRVNGQYAVTNFNRKLSAFMGKNFIYDHASKAIAGDTLSQKYLEALGITTNQVKAYQKFEAENGASGYEMYDSAVGKIVNPMADAVNLFSQQSVMTPNAAQLPLYATDPRFATVAHFKTFFYALYDTFYKGVVGGEFARHKPTAGVMKTLAIMGPTVAFSALTMVALGAFQDMLRNIIRSGEVTMTGDEDEWLVKAFSQSGLMGPATIMESAYNSAGWGRNGVAAAMGPTADYLINDVAGNTTGRALFANSIPFVSQNVLGTKEYARQGYDKFLATDSYE